MSESIVTNEDCRAVMARYPDRHFFTIADPPYGLSITDSHREREREMQARRRTISPVRRKKGRGRSRS